MATYLEIAEIHGAADDSDILKRFKTACLIAAKDIKSEDPGTANHANRLAWANGMFSDDQQGVIVRTRQHLRYAITTNSAFQTAGLAVIDGDIQFIVNSQINLFAV